MNRLLFAFLLFSLAACKSKKKNNDTPATNFFVSDYIKGQVAALDTVRRPFVKIETTDEHRDTSSVTAAEAKRLAKDFLILPDISSDKLRDDYQVSPLYDDLQEAFIFTYITTEAHPVQREDVTVEPQPNAKGQNDIRSMYADYWTTEDSASVRKNMLWEANKSFEITTTTDIPGRPQSVKKVRVIWNGFEGKTK